MDNKYSSVLILNLLYFYCRLEITNELGDDCMGPWKYGLRHVYEGHGHDECHIIDDERKLVKKIHSMETQIVKHFVVLIGLLFLI